VGGATRVQEGLAWARAGVYPFTLMNASNFAATFYECSRDTDAVRALVEGGALDSTEHGFGLLTALAGLHRGWLGGDADAMRASVFAFRDHGGGIGLPTFLGAVAEAYERLGRVEDGLAIVNEALAMAERSGAHYWDAELEHLRGVLLLRRGGGAAQRAAEACLHASIEIARRQQAKMLELRATVSLGRLWRRQGKTAEAHAALRDLYGWFGEGFATPDLCDAKALLDELAAHT
jgi:predicted ATPase